MPLVPQDKMMRLAVGKCTRPCFSYSRLPCFLASPLNYCREVDPLVYNMTHEDPGNVQYNEIGGLQEQIRELREVSVLPLWSPVVSNRARVSLAPGFVRPLVAAPLETG